MFYYMKKRSFRIRIGRGNVFLVSLSMAVCLLNAAKVFATENENVVSVQSVQQSNVVKGQVVDENGEPIIGANVLIKGTSIGVSSDVNGQFSLSAGSHKVTLLVSYVGYVTQEVNVENNRPVRIVLLPNTELLEEVVVTGYGTFKKSAYAGSASTVRTTELQDVPATSFSDL